ncbi:MAG: hypothetical protein LBN25_01280 [Christensenellaceae bacterium]|jgi:uncharacterized ion transporter superfamily protein YfcC|nr:hypothetical protein [Christensenellaceae bacterium]
MKEETENIQKPPNGGAESGRTGNGKSRESGDTGLSVRAFLAKHGEVRGTEREKNNSAQSVPEKGATVSGSRSERPVPEKGATVSVGRSEQSVPEKGATVSVGRSERPVPEKGVTVSGGRSAQSVPEKGATVSVGRSAQPVPEKGAAEDEVNSVPSAQLDDGVTVNGGGTVALKYEKSENKQKTIVISKKAIVTAVLIVLTLIVGSYVLTFILPRGEYQRVLGDGGNMSIVPNSYAENPNLDGIQWWQVLLSPLMILLPTTDGFMTVYLIIFLLLVIGAIFTVLDESGILVYLIKMLARKFSKKKYAIIFAFSFAFMFLGSSVGMLEELIPLVPIVVLLCYAMGWDALVGLGISVLAAAFGFAVGVINPFTVGVAQQIGNLPMFSAIEWRLLSFVISYGLLVGFIFPYAKKVDKNPQKSAVFALDKERKRDFNFEIDDFVREKSKDRAIKWLAGWLSSVIIAAIVAVFWHPLANYIMYLCVVVYIAGGIGSAVILGIRGKSLLKLLGKGALTLAPAAIMICIAGGVRYIITEGDIMDTILYKIVTLAGGLNPYGALLLIYAVIFIFEIFIQSGSAKAFLIMPVIFDLCTLMSVNPQAAVLAYTFADGFANMLLPTNPGLLLILGLTTVSYPKWIKWSGPLQLTLLASTVGILCLMQFAA